MRVLSGSDKALHCLSCRSLRAEPAVPCKGPLNALATVLTANPVVQEIKYHTFFVEGASHVLALDLLQDKVAGRANLPWIQTAIRTLRMLRPRSEMSPLHAVDLADNLERMARFVYPDFRASSGDPHSGVNPVADGAADGLGAEAAYPSQPTANSMLFGLGASPSTVSTPAGFNSEGVEQHGDMLPGDGGWDFDFATADMEAFLSIDPNLASYQLPTYPSS